MRNAPIFEAPPKARLALFAQRAGQTCLLGLLALSAIALLTWQHRAQSAEPAVRIPPPAQDEPATGAHSETAVFAGGCFWGVQGVFQHVRGVRQAVSGYSGGSAATAQYETVERGNTGHAESVRVTFDPTQVSYGRLLQIFFSVAHNPTELNYQGPDEGSQYRSALFPRDDAQRIVAQAYIAQLDRAHVFPQPIVTHIETFKGFFPAESYHQNFLTLHPDNPYIAENDLPKISALKQLFPDRYRNDPVLAATANRRNRLLPQGPVMTKHPCAAAVFLLASALPAAGYA